MGLSLPTVVWDDNLDGTIGGCTRLYVTGTYDVAITLDQQPIKNSPFRVEILSGTLVFLDVGGLASFLNCQPVDPTVYIEETHSFCARGV